MAEVSSLKNRLQDLAEDPTLPSDISDKVRSAAEELEGEADLSIRANSAASILEEVGNDPNVGQHVRTEIWNLASRVENLD